MKEINKFLSSKQDFSHPPPPLRDKVKLYYKNQMSSQYKQEETNLHKIINTNITTNEGEPVPLCIYYKSRKLANLFIKNNPHGDNSKSRVVYQ